MPFVLFVDKHLPLNHLPVSLNPSPIVKDGFHPSSCRIFDLSTVKSCNTILLIFLWRIAESQALPQRFQFGGIYYATANFCGFCLFSRISVRNASLTDASSWNISATSDASSIMFVSCFAIAACLPRMHHFSCDKSYSGLNSSIRFFISFTLLFCHFPCTDYPGDHSPVSMRYKQYLARSRNSQSNKSIFFI